MNLSGAIDILIVLAALYISLSVVVSQIQEGIATLLGLRQKNLYAGILNLLGESANFAEAIVSHPLVSSGNSSTQKRPTYVDARNFSTALWQAVAVAQPPAKNATIDQVARSTSSRLRTRRRRSSPTSSKRR